MGALIRKPKGACISIAILILILTGNRVLEAQNFTLLGDRAFGGSGGDGHVYMLQTGNHFLLTGRSGSGVSGEKTDSTCGPSTTAGYFDTWLVKFDTGFSVLWNRAIGGTEEEINGYSILVGAGGDFLFPSSSYSEISCEITQNNVATDYWVWKLDSNANLLWNKTFQGLDIDRFPQIIQLSSGNFIVCGLSFSPVGLDKTVPNYGVVTADYWVVKFDSVGNKLWDMVYGGTGTEAGTCCQSTVSYSLLAEEDDGFVLAGTTSSPQSGDISQESIGLSGSFDYWIIKVDSLGNKIWDRRYGGSGPEHCNWVIRTADKGYVMVGITNSGQGYDINQPSLGDNDIWFLKLDSLGNKQWDRRYGGSDIDMAAFVMQFPDGSYMISGSTESDSSYDVSENSYGWNDYWMLKIDSAGNKIWDKRFGGPGNDKGSNFVIMPDSSIFLCGSAGEGKSPVKSDGGDGLNDYWVIHFKLSDTITGVNATQPNSIHFAIYPNPAADNITITANKPFNHLRILNVLGEQVQQQEFTSATIAQADVSQLPAGVYFIQVSGNGANGVMKFVRSACR